MNNDERIVGIKLIVFDGDESSGAVMQLKDLKGKHVLKMIEILVEQLEDQVNARNK